MRSTMRSSTRGASARRSGSSWSKMSNASSTPRCSRARPSSNARLNAKKRWLQSALLNANVGRKRRWLHQRHRRRTLCPSAAPCLLPLAPARPTPSIIAPPHVPTVLGTRTSGIILTALITSQVCLLSRLCTAPAGVNASRSDVTACHRRSCSLSACYRGT